MPVEFKVVARRVIVALDRTLALRARRQHLHGEFMIGAEFRDERGINPRRLLDRLGILFLVHECLRQIQANPQHLCAVGSVDARVVFDQFAKQALRLGSVTQPDVGEPQPLLEREPGVFVERRQGGRPVGRRLKIVLC